MTKKEQLVMEVIEKYEGKLKQTKKRLKEMRKKNYKDDREDIFYGRERAYEMMLEDLKKVMEV